MKRFIEGVDRSQTTLFPERLEDWVDDDNPDGRVPKMIRRKAMIYLH